jgi:eukaryotic-like serine/threonine-protein kinase
MRMFNIRFLIRRGIQRSLARGTLIALMAFPIVALAWFLYSHRNESLQAILTGRPALYLLLIIPLLFLVRYRRVVLDAIDRRYFREQYDARQVLLRVVSIVRDGSDILGLSRMVLDEIDRALHPKHAALWQLDRDGAGFVRGMYRGVGPAQPPALPAKSALATLLTTDAEPLDLHSRHNRSLTGRLPVADRLWLASNVAYLVVPLLFDKRLLGMLVLGERMSEEPYSRDDREVLRMLAAHLAFSLDDSRLKASPSLVWSPPEEPLPMRTSDIVRICPSCGRCYETSVTNCTADQRPLVVEEGIPYHIEDKYVISRLLGRGGMGSVYLATQMRLARPVAVKVLLTHLVGSSSMQSRFEREARIVARLRHPSIVTVHDFGVLTTGHAYLVMEYLEGDTLRKLINSGPLEPAKVMEILAPVGEAIDAAHHAGVIHRDLKPENIMIIKDHEGTPTPRVLDFGLAKMQAPSGDDEATLVQSGHSAGIAGTLMYMAPEALSGRAADAKSDQYSLGLIAYELLSGTHPFGSRLDLASVVKGHTDEPPPPLVNVPPRIAAAVEKALAKRPSDRFESVGDFIAAMV